MVWAIVAALLLLFGAVLTWNAYDEYESTLAEEYRAIESQARLGDVLIAGALRSIDLVLQSVIDDEQAIPKLPSQVVRQRQLSLLSHFPEIHYLIVADNKGQVRSAESLDDVDGLAKVRTFNASQRDYFTIHRDAKPEEYYRSELSRPFKTITDRYTVTVSRAIRGKDGRFNGVALVSISPTYFDSVLRQVLSNEIIDAAAVHNRYGDIVYRLPNAEKYIGKNIADGAAFKSYLLSDQHLTRFVGFTVTDSVKRVLVFSKVGDTTLDVGVSAQFDHVMANWHRSVRLRFVIFFIVAGLSLVLAWEAQRRLHIRLAKEKAERRFQAYFERSMVGMATTNPEKGWVDVNPALCEMLGYPAGELSGKTWAELTHPDDLDADAAQFTRLLSGEIDEYEMDKRFIRKDGKIVYAHLAVRAVRKPDTRVDYLVALIEDITERKEVEIEREQYFKFFDTSSDLMGIADPNGAFKKVNPAFMELLGYSEAEILARPFIEFVHTDDRQSTLEEMARQLEHGFSLNFENRYVCKDGSVRLLLWRANVNREEGLTYASARDITQRKQAEEELAHHRDHLEELVAARTAELSRAKEAAEAANVAKTAFLANMSHEIRTPLHAITGMAHLVRRSGVTPQQEEKLDKINSASHHLLEVINAILDLSKIEAGKLELDEIEVNVQAIMANVVSMVTDSARAKQLSLVIESRPLPFHVLGDPTRLQQALLNYATNAIKFTARGTITLRVRLEEETDECALIRFEAQDTGIGIEPDAVPRLFTAFEQADNSMTRKYGGTGLGLAITRHLAELMGGGSGVVSTPGVGSTFWFTARLKKGTPRQATALPSNDAAEEILLRDYKDKKILLVDDDMDNREITRLLLKDVWPRIDTAEDGVEAVEMATRNKYDLILMDMQMPRMDGLEATRRIRKLPAGNDMPILAMTANVFPEHKEQAMAAGMDDVIPKAVDPGAPFTIILKWLARGTGKLDA